MNGLGRHLHFMKHVREGLMTKELFGPFKRTPSGIALYEKLKKERENHHEKEIGKMSTEIEEASTEVKMTFVPVTKEYGLRVKLNIEGYDIINLTLHIFPSREGIEDAIRNLQFEIVEYESAKYVPDILNTEPLSLKELFNKH